MSKPDQHDDVVEVHVTPRGGLYVHERELLRSSGAREMMAKMNSVLQRESRRGRTAERPQHGGQARER